MDFKIDENLPVEVARLFDEAGHSASTAIDEGLGGSTDREIANRCQTEGLILVTLDVGFADIGAYPPADFPGIIVFRLRHQDRGTILDFASRLIRAMSAQEIANELWIVDESRIRIRE